METRHRASHSHYHKTRRNSQEHREEIRKNIYSYSERDIGEDFICTENVEGFSFNYGDEGNPLVANNVLYGIVSWSYGPEEYPNVYTKVKSYKQWIEENAIAPKTTD